jgi:uncharacterized protein YggU (UPF0235/DUF167 family)
VNALEWILALELVCLGIAGVMELISQFIAKQDPDDPIYIFCSTFWREFLWPPVGLASSSGRSGGRSGGKSSASSSARVEEDESSDDDAFYGRIKKGADGRISKVDLVILVEANAAADEVVGRDGEGVRVRVTGEAAEGSTNKAMIEMIATAIGVQPYQVTLTKGHYQVRKTVQVQGMTAAELQSRLSGLAEVD